MDWFYYIVRKNDSQILGGAEDVVTAIREAKNMNCACFIMQGCVISSVGDESDFFPEVETETQDEIPENFVSIEK